MTSRARLWAIARWVDADKLAAVFLLIFAATAVASLMVPVYTDEVQAHLMYGGHVLTDRWHDVMDAPACGMSAFVVPTPIFAMPSHLFDSLLHTGLSPFKIRAIGTTTYVLWVALTGIGISRCTPRASALRVSALLAAGTSIGLLPFLLVLDRPEQPLLVCFTILIVLALEPWPILRRIPWYVTFAFLLFIESCVFAHHAKAFCFVPLLVVAPMLVFETRWQKALFLAVFGLMAVSALRYWTVRTGCPEGIPRSELLPPRLLLESPVAFAEGPSPTSRRRLSTWPTPSSRARHNPPGCRGFRRPCSFIDGSIVRSGTSWVRSSFSRCGPSALRRAIGFGAGRRLAAQFSSRAHSCQSSR